MKVVAAIIVLCIAQPIWFYLLYQILVRVTGSELMFFLFWIYVPVTVLAALILRILDKKEEAK